MRRIPGRPPEADAAAAHTVVDEILFLLVESGCKYLREHPEVKLKLPTGEARAAEVLAGMIGPGDAEAES